MSLFLYPIIGAIAGLLAGLFGVGGGAIIVPLLIFIFSVQGFPEASIVHLAIGTSFATIVITSISSVLAHHKLGNVNWSVVKAMTPGLIIGVVFVALGLKKVGSCPSQEPQQPPGPRPTLHLKLSAGVARPRLLRPRLPRLLDVLACVPPPH